jgi:integrase
MAWIEKREGKRGTTYRVGWRDPSRKLRTRTFTRRRDAQGFAKGIEARLTRRQYVDPALGDVTVADFWEHCLNAWRHLRPSTANRYRLHGRLYVVPGLGGHRVGDVTVANIKELFADFAERGVGSSTQDSVLRILHRMFEVALEEDRVSRNPVRGVNIARTPRRKSRFLDPTEVAAIASEVPGRYRALVYLLAYGGLRIGEAAALRVRALDLTRGVVHVRENVAEVGGRLHSGETKTRRERAVPLPPFLRDKLAEHLEAFGTPRDPDALVFTGEKGAPIRQSVFRERFFMPAARRAGIEPVPVVHDLRHTAASLMARAGLSMRDAQEILGHSRSTMTDRYTHLWPDELAKKVAKLDEMGRTVAPAGDVAEI